MIFKDSTRKLKSSSWHLTTHNAFLLLLGIAGAIVLIGLIAALIYDGISGLDPNVIMRTGVIEGLGESGHGEWLDQTSLIVRLDDGSTIFVSAPRTTFIRIGAKILVSERTSRTFHVKHYSFLKLLD